MRATPLLTALSAIPVLFASPHPLNSISGGTSAGVLAARDDEPLCPSRPADCEQQRQIFADFVQTLYGDKDVFRAFNTHVDENLIEHDPYDEQGRDANAAKLSNIIPFGSFSILHSNFDNDIGTIHLKIDEDPEPVALADLYRMDGTCIVEHWDVAQARPTDATNSIDMF